jgi:hypothetical protein
MTVKEEQDLESWLRRMSPAELYQYKTQLRTGLKGLKPVDRNLVINRMQGIPELYDLATKKPMPTTEETAPIPGAGGIVQFPQITQQPPQVSEATWRQWRAPEYTPTPNRALEYAFYPFAWTGMGAERFGETPAARTGIVRGAFAPSTIPGWVGETARAQLETRPKWQPTPPESLLPGGERYEAYRQLPLWQQFLYELPAYAVAAGIPTAGAIRGALAPAAQAGSRAARVASAALAPIEAGETALRYGIELPIRGVTAGGKRIFQLALDRGLDRWIATQARVHPSYRPVWQNWIFNNREWLAERATNNWLRRSKVMRGASEVELAQTAASDVIREAEPLLLKAAREVPQQPTGARGIVRRALTEERGGITIPEMVAREEAAPLENKLAHQLGVFRPSQVRKANDLVAKELVKHLGGAPATTSIPISAATYERGLVGGVYDRLNSIITRTWRTERRLLQMDGYVEDGKMQQVFYRPLNEATNQKLGRVMKADEELITLAKANNISVGKLLTGRTNIDGFNLSPSERIGVYLHSFNDANVAHLVFGNNMNPSTIDKIIASLMPQEKMIADFLRADWDKQTPILATIYQLTTGKPLETVENYVPIRIRGEVLEFEESGRRAFDFAKPIKDERAMRYASKWASSRIRKGFTRSRTGRALQPIELDAIKLWGENKKWVEHYMAFQPVVRDLQRILNNQSLRQAIIGKYGASTYKSLQQYLKDSVATDPLGIDREMDKVMRGLRVNAVTAVLGLNLVSSGKQLPSFLSVAAEVGELHLIRGMFEALSDWKGTRALIKQYDPQTYRRGFEREIAELKEMRGIRGRLGVGFAPREVATWLLRNADKLAVTGGWRAAWGKALKEGASPQEAGGYAAKVIRRTQPQFSNKDLAELWRSGEAWKMVTIFTNQLNQYWNYYRFDVLGKTLAKKISPLEALRRLLWAFIVPAFLIGVMTRGRTPKDTGEFVQDMASMGLATVPVIGSNLVSGIKGFYGSANPITLELLANFQELAYHINKAQWDKAAAQLPEVASYGIGIPYSQPRRTFEAMLDLAQGNTDDWLRLIWGTYTREKATEVTVMSIEDQIWAKYPDTYKEIANRIAELEETNPSEARRLLAQYPQILDIRREIAQAKAQRAAPTTGGRETIPRR